MPDDKPQSTPLPKPDGFRKHSRRFGDNQWVYPVLSRRSKGISLGINLNPDKVCNFSCVYCQVDRSDAEPCPTEPFSLAGLESELRDTLELISSNEIYHYRPFDAADTPLRRLNDIAISGNGEPTASKYFLDVCRLCATVKDELGLEDVKIIVITNSSLLNQPSVQEGLAILDEHQGEVWAKLDAGTEEHFHLINQTNISFDRILDNLRQCARQRAIVIQSLFCCIDGQRVSRDEIAAYAERLAEIIADGGRIAAVQLHTIARPPRDRRVTALSNEQLDDVVGQVSKVIDIPIQTFYGFAM